MPLVSSQYFPKGLFKNGHFSTIYSAKLRTAPKLIQQRERIKLEDGDFIDLDFAFSEKPTNKIAIILHGLEGNAQRTYMRGQANVLCKNGWDTCAVNYRGCSGETNLSYQSYNAGKTEDLEAIVNHLLEKNRYAEIALVGFSLGGNLLLKYLGERTFVPREILAGVAISVPLSLKGSLEQLSLWNNWVYRTSFLFDLRKKYKQKMKQFPELMSVSDYKKIKSLKTFDDIYTAPAHGFKDAFDYYEKNSSLQFLPEIDIPVLILNAQNDSFLSQNCYPISLAEKSKNIYLETPKYGGHVGFHKTDETYYSEERTLQFLTKR
ncbi:alpha/beta fold hydrolase [Aureisphaera sp. CAU 1614]|uniref:Alpha/beta fold hydrolase n=1 Tax=Halomarinibacterium sedimenti TaxID=2857106 RepID=A0A9X1FQ71_9FLAO|nr:alpha/beta fold hydrolase [Halomarinibacterium sedimenti]MBW2938452.1 alpha/beta fold hydrolase [Halomarinibacterium sedimenti]